MPFLEDSQADSSKPSQLMDRNDPSFDVLVQRLRDALGSSSGSDSADVDPSHIEDIMREYQSTPSQWQRYALADPSRAYTRNLVDEGNGKSNLLIVVWSPGRESPVHDHANAHCVMKILKGALKETLYAMPETSETSVDGTKPLRKTRETTLGENEVTYISDQIGLHKISNASATDFSISLHLYTPPHAARFGFNLFDEKTGKANHIKQATYFSCDGQRI